MAARPRPNVFQSEFVGGAGRRAPAGVTACPPRGCLRIADYVCDSRFASAPLDDARIRRYTPDMSRYYLVVDGYEIRCESATDALELIRVAKGGPAQPAAHRSAGAADIRRRRKPYDQALAVLSAIKDAGESGVAGEKLAKVAGCSAPAGLGTTIQSVGRLLHDLGVDLTTVCEKRRSGGVKLWFAAAAIDDGIVAIKNKMVELFPA